MIPPPTGLTGRPVAEPVAAAIGLDVGGGAVKAGTVLLDSDGVLSRTAQTASADLRTQHLAGADGRVLTQLCAATAADLTAALHEGWPGLPVLWGVSAAAWIAPGTGRSVFSPHLPGWRGRPLPDDLTRALTRELSQTPDARPGPRGVGTGGVDPHIPRRVALPSPSVVNDADAAAWAEARLVSPESRGTAPSDPTGRHPDRMVLVTIGTGIGGALVRDGAVDFGAHGMAGEFGHMTVDPSGVPCPCGNTGCWELLVSAEALAARAGRASARSVLDDALAGDPGCRRAVETTGRWLGRGLATLAAVVDPHRFVIGGGVSVAGELLLAPAREELARHLPGGRHRTMPQVTVATWGNGAGWVGAAGIALERAGWSVAAASVT